MQLEIRTWRKTEVFVEAITLFLANGRVLFSHLNGEEYSVCDLRTGFFVVRIAETEEEAIERAKYLRSKPMPEDYYDRLEKEHGIMDENLACVQDLHLLECFQLVCNCCMESLEDDSICRHRVKKEN